MIALGWANIGAAVAPDAALASVASAIILVQGDQGVKGVGTAIAIAVPLAVAGLFLTMIVRTIAVPIVHIMDAAAEEGNYRKIEVWQVIAVCLQGLRIAIPAAALLVIPAGAVKECLGSNACMVVRRHVHRRRHGCCRRLRNGYQHDGYA